MKRIWRYFSKNWFVAITIIVFIILTTLWLLNPCDILSWFFGKENTQSNADILSYIGVVCGAIIIGTLFANNKRNLITEKGQLDIRFKDAALLLSNYDTASILSGIYALHQVALETSKREFSEKGYIKVIHDIFCAYLKENSEILSIRNGVIERGTNSKPIIVIQTIIDVLFKSKIYYNIESNLSKCVFINIDFSDAKLRNVKFADSFFQKNEIKSAYIEECSFFNSTIEDTYIIDCNFISVILDSTYMKNNKTGKNTINDCCFSEAYLLDNTFRGSFINNSLFLKTNIIQNNFMYSRLTKCSFTEAKFKNVSFENAILNDCCFSKASIENIDFSKASFKDNRVDFSGTILEDALYDEILLFSKSLTDKTEK